MQNTQGSTRQKKQTENITEFQRIQLDQSKENCWSWARLKELCLETLERCQRTLTPWWQPLPPAGSGWLACREEGKGWWGRRRGRGPWPFLPSDDVLGFKQWNAKPTHSWAGLRALGQVQRRRQAGGGRRRSWRGAGGGRRGRTALPPPKLGGRTGQGLASWTSWIKTSNLYLICTYSNTSASVQYSFVFIQPLES